MFNEGFDMVFDENFDVEKINSLKGCGECVFCLAKCPKCSTVDVQIEYQRHYEKDGSVSSCAILSCKCGRTVVEEHTLPKEITGGKPSKYEVYRQDERHYLPKLTDIFDEDFEDCKPKESTEVSVIYVLENNTEDELDLHFEHITKNVEFTEELPSSIRYEASKQNDGHSKITATMRYCTLVKEVE